MQRLADLARALAGAVALRIALGAVRLRTRGGKAMLGWIAAIALVAYAALTLTIYLAQRSLMYFPDTAHVTPAAAGLPEAEEVPLTDADGTRIHVWHVPPRGDRPVILFFHGNGGSLASEVDRFHRLISDGIGLIGVEYRGYGGSEGSPSERGLIADAEAAYAFAVSHYPVQQIVVWGGSLGSGVAVALAAEKPIGRLILEAPYTSTEAVGAQHVLVPAGALPDEGSISFGPAHRQSEGAVVDLARHARSHRALFDGRTDVRARQQAQTHRAFP